MTDLSTLAAGLTDAQRVKRNWRGQFVKKLRHTEPDSREWLIWSRYHRAWHRRDIEGRACGYTSDIAQAGVFSRSKAEAYNDGDRNEAFHVSERIEQLTAVKKQHLDAIENLDFALRAYLERNPEQ